MHRCIDADLKRILKKNTFRLMFGIVLVAIIICIIAVFVRDKDKNAEFQLFLTRVAELNAMLIGIPVFLAIFADDFKSRAMQTAIASQDLGKAQAAAAKWRNARSDTSEEDEKKQSEDTNEKKDEKNGSSKDDKSKAGKDSGKNSEKVSDKTSDSKKK